MVAALAEGDKVSQRRLSRAIDRAMFEGALLDPSTPQHIKAHLRFVSSACADAWLHAAPSEEAGTRIPSESAGSG